MFIWVTKQIAKRKPKYQIVEAPKTGSYDWQWLNGGCYLVGVRREKSGDSEKPDNRRGVAIIIKAITTRPKKS